MKLLLDTHTYLWLRLEPHRLSRRAATEIDDKSNQLFVSLVSLWEMTIKSAKGQLKLPAADIRAVGIELDEFDIELLGIDTEDVSALEGLPSVHKDPFDRLLIAQAKRHGLILVTDDGLLRSYGVPILWK